MSTKTPITLGVEGAEASGDPDLTEERMRRALGLGGEASREVLTIGGGSSPPLPTEVATSRRSRQSRITREAAASHAATALLLSQQIAELEGRLTSEREQHDEARRQLQQAQLAVRDLEAKLDHSLLSQQAELDLARQVTVAAQRAMDEATFDKHQRDASPRASVTRSQAGSDPGFGHPAAKPGAQTLDRPLTAPHPSAEERQPSKKRGRPRIHPVPEPKPVRWWTPSFRAKAKR